MATSLTTAELQPISPEQAALPNSKESSIPPENEVFPSIEGATGRPSSIFSGTGHVVRTKERWNNPKRNTYRLAAIFYAFVIFGMNDASYGALIPYVGSCLIPHPAQPPLSDQNQQLIICIPTARTRLPPLLPSHIPRLPLPLQRLHPLRLPQRPSPPPRRPPRHRLHRALIQTPRLHSHIMPSALPRRRRHPRLRRHRQRLT